MDPECSGRSQEMHINHVDGRDWEPRDFDMSRRVARYWREYESGVRLSVLCKECNSMSRNRPGYVPEEPVF